MPKPPHWHQRSPADQPPGVSFAVGYLLDELAKDITRVTRASFESSIIEYRIIE